MKRSLILFVFIICSTLSYSQNTHFGLFASPEVNMLLQNPNKILTETITPGFGYSVGLIGQTNFKDAWSLRSGFSLSRTSYTTKGFFAFEDDINATLGTRTKSNIAYTSFALPLNVIYSKPESNFGVIGGVDVVTHFRKSITNTYMLGELEEQEFLFFINPAIYLAVQLKFPVADKSYTFVLEPYTQVHIRSFLSTQSNLLSLGLRAVIQK
jgi:hypothetical protein